MESYSCDDIREKLSGYIDSEADGAEAAAVEEHIKTCAECRRELEELLWLREGLDSSKPATPGDLHEKIMSRVRAENALA